jgi:hypothetical protein
MNIYDDLPFKDCYFSMAMSNLSRSIYTIFDYGTLTSLSGRVLPSFGSPGM